MKILEHRTLYRDGEYVAFPNLAFLPDGRLMCAFRHAKERQKEFGRVTHVDPTAKDVYILSEDNGKTFSPELHVIIDDEMSDQDPCVNVLSDGRIIVTYFRWALVPIGEGSKTWGEEVFKRYGRTLHGKYDCFTDGASYSISDDCGKTWRHMPVISPEGYLKGTAIRGNLVELDDGTLLLPFYGSKNPGELSRAGLLRSDDRGESWYYYSEMAYDSQGEKNFLEPGIYRTESGRIIGLFRTQTDFLKKGVDFEQTYLNLHMSVSEDDGKTFGPVFEADTLWGSSPFHALRLKSGKVLVTYGYRRKPFGIRARLCNGELSDLNEAPEMILRDDAPNGDLGYPHSIQLPDGTIMVSYYISGDDGIRKIDATLLAE
ncbi:MAG: sialidase family protein [Caldicoprobacterales bacterium]|nr:exo-alpha-sialidase [Clostridiales bacterium]